MKRFPDTHRLVSDDTLYSGISSPDSSIAELQWKELFTDPWLRELIEKAISGNPDMRVAAARIQKADAAFRQSRAEFFPSLNAGLNASFQSTTATGFGVPEVYQLYGSSSWETGIWGRLRSSKKAALANLLATESAGRAVLTGLVSSIAMNYYALLALDAQLRITERTVDRRIRNAETMEVLKANDVITGADLVLSQANRYSAEVIIPDLKQRIFETENLLSFLAGLPPGPVSRGTLDEQDTPAELNTGIAASLLSNRPDVAEAEYRVRQSFELTRVARSFFYPSLTITARGGLTETSIQNLFNAPATFWSIAGGLLQPVFNNGLNRQRLRSANADLEESLALFEKTLLAAGGEVTDALSGYNTATEKIGIREMQIELLERSVEYTMELLKYTSSTSYIDVLTSEVNLLSAQLAVVNDRLEQLQAVVSLYRSLGGGWK